MSNNDTETTAATLTIERERGLPINIQCISSDTTEELQTLTLLFGYEFAIIDPRESISGEVIVQDLPSLEYFLLHHIAKEIGLLSCDDTEERTVVGLSNLTPDEWERDIECTELTDLSPELICIPVRGIMQASYVESDADSVETMLTDTITSVLNGPGIRTQGIVDTVFIGSRVIADPRSADAAPVSPAIWGASASAALLIVAAVAGMFLVGRRKQRRTKQQNQSSEIIPDLPVHKVVEDPTEQSDSGKQRDIENPVDQEVPSVDPLMLSIATTRTASETIVDTDDSLNLQDGSTANNSAAPRVPAGSPTPPSVINLQPRPKAADGTALIRPPPSNKPPLPVGKPPASPRSPSAAAAAAALSKPLKQQRRRKKRRKKPKMVRVNSRERASEMETITETPEETSDSEYSWYSETDSNASSRDASPSRGSPVPSTTSSEDQLMVQLRQSLDSPMLSSSSKDDSDDDMDEEVAKATSRSILHLSGSAESSSGSSSSPKGKADGELPSNEAVASASSSDSPVSSAP